MFHMSSSSGFAGFGTSAIHAGQRPEQWEMWQIVPPISLATSYKQPAPGEPIGHAYGRSGNPTRDVLQANLAALENAKYCTMFGSGLAATNAVLNLLKTGDHIICSEDIYGGTSRQLNSVISPNYGVQVEYSDLTHTANLSTALKENTKMVWLESPTNPLLKVVDIEAVCEVVNKFNQDIVVVVDNTFMTPYFQRPLSLGADVVVHSCTKYINGHSDVVMGAALTDSDTLRDHIFFQQKAVGGVPSAFDCYLVNRGLKTLHLRMKSHMENAMAVATFLEGNERIEKVLYPELPSHPQHLIHKKQTKGMSGMISFYLRGDGENTRAFLSSLKIFSLAESLGGFESMAALPCVMSHGSVAPEVRSSLGITDNLVRLSVGVEDADDLIADIQQALRIAVS